VLIFSAKCIHFKVIGIMIYRICKSKYKIKGVGRKIRGGVWEGEGAEEKKTEKQKKTDRKIPLYKNPGGGGTAPLPSASDAHVYNMQYVPNVTIKLPDFSNQCLCPSLAIKLHLFQSKPWLSYVLGFYKIRWHNDTLFTWWCHYECCKNPQIKSKRKQFEFNRSESTKNP